ncbi:MFS transporter [Timonella sp. A28]|uniref:MFS transporter n=1 Tax=Timonella sp. A28 TaxID=3442640 RepID=UPI003EB98C38
MTTHIIDKRELNTYSETKSVRFLAFSQGFQSLGGSIFTVSLAVFAGAQQDILGLGLVLAARTLPTVFIALVGGVVADAVNRKTVAVATLFIVGALNFLLFWVVGSHGLGVAAQLISVIAGLATAFGTPALYALLPSIVSKERNFQANAFVRTFRNAGALLGPIAVVFIAARWGALCGLGVSAGCLLIAGLFLLPLRVPAAPVTKRTSTVSNLKDAVRLGRRHRWLPFMIAFWAVFLAVQAGAFGVTQPVFATQEFGPQAWAAMSVALSGGYILTSFVATKLSLNKNLMLISVVFAALSAIPNLVMAVSPHVALLCVGAFVSGVGLEISGIAWGSTLQTRVEREHIGKVSSLDYAVSFGFVPVGYALYGVLGQAVDAHTLLLGTAVILFTLTLIALVVIISNRYDTLPTPSSETTA